MDFRQTELYQRLQRFSLDAIEADMPFSHRLARDNVWTFDYARRAIEEYKKFAVLAVIAGHPVTPSDQVDQVWHLHLLYTQSYWGEFCPKILQTPLHHNPTKGGQQEHNKFSDWYARTLQSYEAIFQQTPPADIWPPSKIRFGQDLAFRRINTQQHWIIPKLDLSWLSQYRYHGLGC
ncbi:MAG: TIGR04222 domain-containing membrane protein, partial [Cyanobacteria bacterium J06636_16]